MKALSVRQPWAQAIALGVKRIETRSWWTAYRGPLAIHAAKRADAVFGWLIFDPIREAGYSRFADLPFGAVVATCRLVECVSATDVDRLTAQERMLGDYSSPGKYAWILADIKALKRPIPYRGAQRLFEIPVIGETTRGEPQTGLWTK